MTHEVFNQSTPLAGYNVYGSDRALRDALAFHLPDADDGARLALGERLGSAEMQQHARLANIHKPELHTHDRFGRRVDTVEFHPSYHALMDGAVRASCWAHSSAAPRCSGMRGWPTSTSQSCTRTTGSAGASTRSSSIRAITR